MLYQLIKSIIFRFDPEWTHELILKQMKRVSETRMKFLLRKSIPTKYINCMGIDFKNPLGLAAGFDKNGEYLNVLGSMGFGFIEVGTVTPSAQSGNKKPRLFRLVKARGLINHMGFNNKGVDNLIENIKISNFNGILGISIGKNKNTPLEYAKEDYLTCIEKIYNYANYIAINISSPNTPGLRYLQFGYWLDDLLSAVKKK